MSKAPVMIILSGFLLLCLIHPPFLYTEKQLYVITDKYISKDQIDYTENTSASTKIILYPLKDKATDDILALPTDSSDHLVCIPWIRWAEAKLLTIAQVFHTPHHPLSEVIINAEAASASPAPSSHHGS
ncbi:hypothetical protein [Jeotgalibacillus aurantiacus]|uniref:hypothetical protein n=1 Tax=Jeotgalibacillus aurantiacus TaxID=2763266 RepID=UPI001D0BBA71|nr:hypothetical protein [Jeotgalibacillus aurantiacus]